MRDYISDSCDDSYRQGWLECAAWAERDDLVADIDSPAYIGLRNFRIQTIKDLLRIMLDQPLPPTEEQP